MTDIEQLISRYLDHELSPKEEETFHRILSESPTARWRLREMEEIRSAARRIPTLTMPTPQVESLLFQQLFAEESSEEPESRRRRAIPLLSRVSGTARRRSGVLATALLLFALIGGGGLWIATENSGSDNSPLADATVRSVGATSSSAAPGRETGKESATFSSESEVAIAADETGFSSSAITIADIPVGRSASRGENNSATTRGLNSTASRNDRNELNETDRAAEPKEATSNAFADNGSLPIDKAPKGDADVSSWPPLNLLAKNEVRANSPKHLDDAVIAQPEERRASFVYPTESLPETHGNDQAISASYRHGLTYLKNEQNQFTTQDFSLRIEGRFDNRHRLSLAVGQSPLLVERTTHILPTGIALDDKGASPASAERIEHFSQLVDEVWAGIGYGYAVVSSERVRVEPGLNLGVGERSLRFSAELPVRYRLTDRFSLDLVASVSRVQPHNQILRDVDREYDRRSFLHVDEEQHPVFTSVGASIGLSFDIGR